MCSNFGVIRGKLEELSDWAYERTLDMNFVSSFGKAGFVMRARYFEPSALDVDMTGRVCLVTGANTGLGYATAKALAARGATLYLLCRNQERGTAALERLREETESSTVHLEIIDLSEPGSIRAFVERFSESRVDVLVNNAGVLLDERSENSQGIEMTWATHLLGPYLLTTLLIPKLEAAGHARVIIVSSAGMYLRKLDLDDWSCEKGAFDGVAAYAKTKRAQVILAEEMAAKYRDKGISINSMHPGWVDTDGVRSSLPRFYRLTRSILRSWAEGADTIVWMAVAPEAHSHSGELLFDREPRRKVLFPWTRESSSDRDRLMRLLESGAGDAPDAEDRAS